MFFYDIYRTPSHLFILMNSTTILSSITQTIISTNTTITHQYHYSYYYNSYSSINDSSFKNDIFLLIYLIQSNLDRILNLIFTIKQSILTEPLDDDIKNSHYQVNKRKK